MDKKVKNKTYSFVFGWLFNFPVRLFFPTKLIGKENLPIDEKVITVSNHMSLLEIPLIASKVKGYRHFIAKKEIGKSKFIFNVAKKMGVIFVDRSKADISAMREVFTALKNGEGISMFPEGTRNRSGNTDLQDVKNGACMFAIKGNAPVVPIVFYKKAKLFSKNYMFVDKPFKFDGFSTPLSAEELDKAGEILAEKMQNAKDYLTDYVLNKRWKEEKREKKAEKKREKFYKKESKKAFKAAEKNMKKQGKKS